MINYKRKVNVYAKGTRTNLQGQTNDNYTKIHLFSLSCVSILLVSSLSATTDRCDGLTQEHAAGVFDVFLDLEGVSLRFLERGGY